MLTNDLDMAQRIEELEDRLAAVECLLGLLPSGPDFESRAVFVAFQIAAGNPPEQILDSVGRLEHASPGFLRRVEDFTRDMKGQSAAALLRFEPKEDAAC